MSSTPILEIRDLKVRLPGAGDRRYAAEGIALTVNPREIVCIVGESGSGKSVTASAVMGLLPKNALTLESGQILLSGRDITHASLAELRALRGDRMAMIFQEPMTALDPVFTVGSQIAEVICRHEGATRKAAMRRTLELLELVQIPSAARRLSAFPHELSGGLRQRVMIAMALACKPELLLADEPTTALDATVQIQILLLLKELQTSLGMGLIFVTHDIGVAAEIADRVGVMYAGRLVEEAPVQEILRNPRHPYTRGLLASTLHDALPGSRLTTISGSPPDLDALPNGCSFGPRCPYVSSICEAGTPPITALSRDHRARCFKLSGECAI